MSYHVYTKHIMASSVAEQVHALALLGIPQRAEGRRFDPDPG